MTGAAGDESASGGDGQPEQRLVKLRRPGRPKGSKNQATLERPKLPSDEPAPPREELEEAFTAGDELPPEEPDPSRRTKPTIGRIELTNDGASALRAGTRQAPDPIDLPDLADSVPRTLDDLMGMFPIGYPESQYYVYVDRKQPTAYHGVATKGILRPVRRALTLSEFRSEYGGGVYELIVYGPPPRGRIIDDDSGLPRVKALTKPIRITIPWHGDGGHPPNPDAAFENEEEQEEASMADQGGIPSAFLARGVTPASAKIYETHTRHAETIDERDRGDRTRARMMETTASDRALRLMAEQHERERADQREIIKKLEARLDESKKNSGTDLEGIAKLMGNMNPRAGTGEIQAMRETHVRELESIERRHKEELDTLRRQGNEERERSTITHRAELDRLELRLKGAEERANERVKVVEERLDRLNDRHDQELSRTKSELKGDHLREIESLKNEHGRQLETQRGTFQMQLETERRSNERDLATSKEIASGQLLTEKTRLDMELTAAKAELRRRDRELEEVKRIAEKSKDLGALMEEAERTVRLLGYEKPEPGGAETPELDWKTILMSALAQGAKQLPDILKSAGEAVGAIRGAPQRQQMQMLPGQGMAMPMPAQQPPLPGYSTFAPQPRTFATENSPGPESVPMFHEQGGQGVRPEPVQTEQVMQPATAPVAGQMEPAHFPPMAGQPPAQMAAPAPRPQPSVAPPPPSPSVAPQAGAPAVDPHVDMMILSGKDQIEAAFSSEMDPTEIAKGVLKQYGKEHVTHLLPVFKPETVVGAFTRAGVSTRLTSRKGQRYLREIDRAIRQELEKAS